MLGQFYVLGSIGLKHCYHSEEVRHTFNALFLLHEGMEVVNLLLWKIQLLRYESLLPRCRFILSCPLRLITSLPLLVISTWVFTPLRL